MKGGFKIFFCHKYAADRLHERAIGSGLAAQRDKPQSRRNKRTAFCGLLEAAFGASNPISSL